MERKAVIGLAAVAAVGLLLYLRKNGATEAQAGTGSVLTSNAALLNAAMGNAMPQAKPVTINVTQSPTKPQPVADPVVKTPAPSPAPTYSGVQGASTAPAPEKKPKSGGHDWGGIMAQQGMVLRDGKWVFP